jgi:hypothetical protein
VFLPGLKLQLPIVMVLQTDIMMVSFWLKLRSAWRAFRFPQGYLWARTKGAANPLKALAKTMRTSTKVAVIPSARISTSPSTLLT